MSNIVINISDKNAKWLAEHNLQVMDLVVLKIFQSDNLEILQNYLAYTTSDQKLVFFQSLVRRGWLEMLVEVDEFSWDNYKLTTEAVKALEFLESIEVISLLKKEEIIEVTSSNTSDVNIVLQNSNVIIDQEKETIFDNFVEEFRTRWPEGRNGGGVSFRGNKIDIKSKLLKFMNKYKFDKETILKAADLYLSTFRRKGFEYCQAAEYFILKNQTSALAGYCEMVLKNVTTGSSANPFEQTM